MRIERKRSKFPVTLCVSKDNTDPYKAASTGLVTATLPTSMEDSVADDGTVVSGSEKLKVFLAAYQSYDGAVEFNARKLDADSTVDNVKIATWVGDADTYPVYEGDEIIGRYSAWSSQDFDITPPTGNTDATAGYADVPVTVYYSVGEDNSWNTPIYEQPLTLHVKWGAGKYYASETFTNVQYNDYFLEAVSL